MMDAEAMGYFYGYHFAANRVLWERYVQRYSVYRGAARAFARFTAFLGARALGATASREPLLRQRISAVTESRL